MAEVEVFKTLFFETDKCYEYADTYNYVSKTVSKTIFYYK